jgi:hypothetical protein
LRFDDYGFQIGESFVTGLTGEEFARFVVASANHLMLNGHRFELVKTGEIDLPVEMRSVK